MTDRFDVAIIGAGPAGIAAAIAAASHGRQVCLLDEGFHPGGQIWRHRSGHAPTAAQRWLDQLAASSVRLWPGTSVFGIEREASFWRVSASVNGDRQELDAAAIVLACGARERFLPFPGWTLPGVMGAGGGQALLKEGLELRDAPVLVAGSGPLLLPVAASVRKAKGQLLAILEQTPRGNLLRMVGPLLARPAKAWQALQLGFECFGVPYRPGWWVKEALGDDRLEAVRITNGRKEMHMECRWLFCGFGLVPNLEAGQGLGCASTETALIVDGSQATSVPGIFAAGEVCGVAGVDSALVEGTIAGLAASQLWDASSAMGRKLSYQRAKARRMGFLLDDVFRLRPELKDLPRPETLVCRCEDVPYGAIDPSWSARETKLCTRAGMGPCQGRVCGPILAQHFGHKPDTVRIPWKAVPLSHLVPEDP